MNIDDIKALLAKKIIAGKNDLADTYKYEVSNPLVQTSEALRLLVEALHQGSPSTSERMEKLTQMVSPFTDYADKILDDLADETIQENNADLSYDELADSIYGSELIIDHNMLDGLQDEAKQLATIEPSAFIGLHLAVCTVRAIEHSSALYSSSISGDPQQMARQCEQECRDANNMDKTIRQSLNSEDLCNVSDKIGELIEEIYKDRSSPAAKQHARQLSELTDRFRQTAASSLQWTACARLNVLNARQFIDDLTGKIEDGGLEDLTATVAEANNAFNQLLDDISPALYGMLLTNCVAHKLLTQVS